MVLSSAYKVSLQSASKLVNMSLMYIKNNKGPKMLHWGIPHVEVFHYSYSSGIWWNPIVVHTVFFLTNMTKTSQQIEYQLLWVNMVYSVKCFLQIKHNHSIPMYNPFVVLSLLISTNFQWKIWFWNQTREYVFQTLCKLPKFGSRFSVLQRFMDFYKIHVFNFVF
jgi:hypothetical protein